ncbi:UNVERIFIED_ORG: hypothetical protein M2402_003628 [Rahnella aquatilis]
MMKHEEATPEMAEAMAKRIDIDLEYTIIPKKNGDLILAEIKTDKETNKQYCSTLDVHQLKFSLAAEFINRSVNRAIRARRITSSIKMRAEYNRAADLVFAALVKIQQLEVANG